MKWAGLVASLLVSPPARGTEPTIYKIELLGTNQVLVHFDTDPNRSYTLQYINTLSTTNGVLTGTWSDLYVAPVYPFSNHYIIVDAKTNKSRYYRLKVSP